MRKFMTNTIYLFPDTNLFIQCKPLKELDWSGWSSFDEVHLYVSRPVQAEIDRQKGNGNSRLSKRARNTSKLFRDILLSEEGYFEVCNINPTVRIYLRQDLKPDETLSDQLSYAERDDQLVGIAALFANNNDANVQILTHDTGPMTTAKMVGLRFKEIPESWLLPPEADETKKRVKALQDEITRLRKTEPAVKVRIENAVPDKPGFDLELPFYSALNDDQFAIIIERITRNFPPQTDFGSKIPEERHNNSIFAFLSETEVFSPATNDEIADYQNKSYPAWLQQCETLLGSIHEQLNENIRWPEVTFLLSNNGTRPADDVLITLSAKGNFKIQPPPHKEKTQESKSELALPRPPLAPQGRWTKKHPRSFLGIYDNPIGHALQRHDYLNSDLISPIIRNPNYFYYQSRPGLPVDMYSLTCTQWRHQDGEEAFQLTMHVELKPKTTIKGALEVKIHAANMTDPVLVRHPVHITVKEMSVLDKADELVTNLIEGTI
jgi:hypothetical protein